MFDILKNLLSIESPTYKEQEIIGFLKNLCENKLTSFSFTEYDDCLIIKPKKQKGNKKHISLVGHCDVVPKHFTPYDDNDKIFGSGASDMKGALAVFLSLALEHDYLFNNKYFVSIVIYCREEGTVLQKNGLFSLIKKFPDFFKSIDLAIIGEPTDNEIQMACMGSIHYQVDIFGKRCHSARPWEGKNALYQALKFIEFFSNYQGEKVNYKGQQFTNVIAITQSHSESGTTSIPGYWQANINFRFSPNYSEEEAQQYLENIFKSFNMNLKFKLTSSCYAGKIIENSLSKLFIEKNNLVVTAKQAWTDVAQIANLDIACFNYGPGLPSQAHKDNEYILKSNLIDYRQVLLNFLKD